MKKVPSLLSCFFTCLCLQTFAQTTPPTISGLSISAGIPGSTVTISGSGFNTTAANNIVYFGATRANVTAAGSTSLSVTVPVGATYERVSVNNTAIGLTGLSPYPFLPTFSTGGYTPALNIGSYKDIEVSSLGWRINRAIAADINNDGKPDLVATANNSSSLQALLIFENSSPAGGGTADFSTPPTIMAAGNCAYADVAIKDVDGDGKPDIVVPADTIRIYRNLSVGGAISSASFAAPVKLINTAGGTIAFVEITDVNADGKNDIVLCGGELVVYRNGSSPGSITASSFTMFDIGAAGDVTGFTTGDLTGDGKPEFGVARQGTSLMLWQNTSNGDTVRFVYTSTEIPAHAKDIVFVDINGDNKLDLVYGSGYSVVAKQNNYSAGILSISSFGLTTNVILGIPGQYMNALTVADMDGDGKPDIAANFVDYSGTYGPSVQMFLAIVKNTNIGGAIATGSFSAPSWYYGDVLGRDITVINGVDQLSVSDLDGDTRPDVIITGMERNIISIVQCQVAPPTISAISAISGNAGTSITLTGTNFNSTASNNVVTFGATKAAVTSATTTGVTVTVPQSATVSQLSLLNTATGKLASSTALFTPTHDHSAYAAGSINFDGHVDYSTPNWLASPTKGLRLDDVDGDGKVDIVQSRHDSLLIFRNISTPGSITPSSFATPVILASFQSGEVMTADLDGDGKKDILICHNSGYSVFRNLSTAGSLTSASFATRVELGTGYLGAWSSYPDHLDDVSIADMDGDGKLDLVGHYDGFYAGSPVTGFGVIRNFSSPGHFEFDEMTPFGGFYTANIWIESIGYGYPYDRLKIADFDNDGKPDIIYSSSSDSTTNFRLFRNVAQQGCFTTTVGIGIVTPATASSFADSGVIVVPASTSDFVVYDMDGDGKKDIVSRSWRKNRLTVMRNTGAGSSVSFATPVSYNLPQWLGAQDTRIALGDMDGDNKADVVVTNDSSVSIFRNISTSGTISLAPRLDKNVPANMFGLSVADMDGDNRPDIITSNWNSGIGSSFNGFSILRNNPANISGITNVCVGSTSTLTSGLAGGTWVSASSAIATIGLTSGVLSGVSGGTSIISYVYSGGVSTVMATIDAPLGTTGITGTLTFCQGTTTALTGSPAGGLWISSGAGVSVSSAGVVSGTAAGTSVVTYSRMNVCGTSSITVTVTVSPAPNGLIAPGNLVCLGGMLTLTPASMSGGSWSSTNPSVGTIDAATGVIAGVATGTTIVSYTVTNSCGTNTGTRSVTVQTPVTGSISGAATVCTGSQVTLSHAGTTGTWSSGNVGTATITSSGVVTGGAAGTVIISYTMGNSCGTVINTQVATVNTTPSAITGTASVAISGTTTLSDATVGGVWTSSTSSIATINASTGVVSGVALGTSRMTYTLPNGCFVSRIVTVNTTISPITGTTTVCASSSTTLSDAIAGGTWSSSNPTVATVGSLNGIVSGLIAGTAIVSYTYSAGTATTIVTVVSANAGSVTGVSPICAGTSTLYSTTGSGGSWISGNPAVASVLLPNGSISGVSGGTAIISYVVSNACGISLATATISVTPVPDSGIISGAGTVCVGATLFLSESTPGGSWISAAPAIATVNSDGVLTGVAPGTTLISYQVVGCGVHTATSIVSVNGLPNAGSITGLSTVCPAASITLSNTVTGGTWSSGGMSVAAVSAGGIVTGITQGVVTVSYTVTNGCGSQSATKSITVNAAPSAGTLSGPPSVSVGGSITVLSTISGGTWSISGPNATVNASGTVTGLSTGTAVVTYTLAAVCGIATATKLLSVGTAVAPIAGNLSVCTGSTGTLTVPTSGGTWSSSLAAIATIGATTGVITPVAAGTTIITYSAGGSFVTTVFTVYATPTSITGILYACTGRATTLSSVPSGGTWSSGNDAIASAAGAGLITGNTAGVVPITYTTTGGCRRSTVVSVNNTPSVISGAASACSGATIILSNTLLGGNWTMSSGGFATLASSGATGTATVTGTNAGNYTLSYTVAGCTITKLMTTNVTPGYITGVAKACPGTSTALANPTAGGFWESGNTSVGTVNAATGLVTGITPGTAAISYVMSSGCYRSLAVTVNAFPGITGTTGICAGSNVTLYGGTSGTWVSSTSTVATVGSANGVVMGITTGTAAITFTSASTGCSGSTVVNVNGTTPITGALTVCALNATSLSNAIPGGTWSVSSAAVASVSSSGVVVGNTTGTTIVSYIVGSACARTAVVTVQAVPALPSSPAVCEGTSVSLGATPTGGTWTGGIPGIATITSSGLLMGITIGTAPVIYTGTNGCSKTVTATVGGAIGSISGGSTVCANSTLALTTGVSGGVWISSNATAATIGGSSGLVTGLTIGTTNITYSLGGCATTAIVSVLPAPSTITGVRSVCVNATTILASSPSGGTWSSSNAVAGTVNPSSGVVTGLSAGTTVVMYTGVNGCGSSATVTVNGLPVITGPLSICETGTTALTTTNVNTLSWLSSNPSIATVSAIGVATGVAAGTTIITYTVIGGCYSTAILTVNARPAIISGMLTICSGRTTTLSSSPAGGTWTSGNTLIATVGSNDGVVTTLLAGNPVITYTGTNGCARTVTATVYASPGNISGASTVCQGSTTLLSIAGSGTWSSTASAIASVPATNGVVTGVSAGAATIVFTAASNGCTSSKNITVAACPRGMATTTGIADNTAASLSFYPNPSKGTFTVTTPEAGTITMFTIDGREISQQNVQEGSTEIALPESVAPGVYMCRFTGASGNVTTVRIVVERN